MIRIRERAIGRDARPYLIAEMSGNHNRSLDRALEIVDAAADSGADAIKLQTYTAETMTLDVDAPGFVIDDPSSPWAGRHLYELYAEASTPWEWHAPLMERAAARGIDCFSSAFDETAVDFLETLDVPAYKVASFELTDLPLVRKVAGTGKPMILSTGMATLAEIDEAVQAAQGAGCTEIALLKCTSTYPATPESSNLHSIPVMRAAFPACEIGLSDHTMGCGVSVAAVALGACIIEKHFTLRRADGGVDSTFSLEPHEFALLRAETERGWQSLGDVTFGGTKSEEQSKIYRRSIYVSRPMRRGDTLSSDNVRIVRPGYGLPPKYVEAVIGRTVARDVEAGTPLSWELLA